MQKRFVKILSVVFILLFVFSAFPISSSAADPGLIKVSNVENDLKAFGVDITDYQKDVNAEHCRMLKFFEYGYDYYGGRANYGLYVYLYNPSGKAINTTSGSNTLQLAVLSEAGTETTAFRKLKLKLVNYSTTEGYEHVFYKFAVEDVKESIFSELERDMRQYDISSVNLQFAGENNPTSFKVGGVYTYTA